MTEPPKAAGTSYVVLEQMTQNDGPEVTKATYRLLTTVEATNGNSAIRKAIANKPGTYIAIPARSFAPVTVKVETQTVVKLST